MELQLPSALKCPGCRTCNALWSNLLGNLSSLLYCCFITTPV